LPELSEYTLLMPPGGRPSLTVKKVKCPSRYRAAPVLKLIQILPARSSPKESGPLSLNEGSPGAFSRLRKRLLWRSQRASPHPETQTLPPESVKTWNTCGFGSPSFVVYMASG